MKTSCILDQILNLLVVKENKKKDERKKEKKRMHCEETWEVQGAHLLSEGHYISYRFLNILKKVLLF